MDNTLDRLPPDPRGYAVDLASGIVHARYPKHETGPLHRTSPTGLLNMQVDHELTACSECIPSAKKARSAKKAPEPVAAPDPEPEELSPYALYQQSFPDQAEAERTDG